MNLGGKIKIKTEPSAEHWKANVGLRITLSSVPTAPPAATVVDSASPPPIKIFTIFGNFLHSFFLF
jgi:hypothetical protein